MTDHQHPDDPADRSTAGPCATGPVAGHTDALPRIDPYEEWDAFVCGTTTVLVPAGDDPTNDCEAAAEHYARDTVRWRRTAGGPWDDGDPDPWHQHVDGIDAPPAVPAPWARPGDHDPAHRQYGDDPDWHARHWLDAVAYIEDLRDGTRLLGPTPCTECLLNGVATIAIILGSPDDVRRAADQQLDPDF